MGTINLQLIPKVLYEQYKKNVSGNALLKSFNKLEDAVLSTDDFNFNHAVASVYSSKIEEESIELDSYIKHKNYKMFVSHLHI